MRSLQEGSLLKKGFLYFMLPSFCLAILSIWFPFIYAIVPADESLDCFCSLLDNFPHWKNRISVYNYVDTDYEIVPDFYMILNMIIFYAWNWAFIMVNSYMLYKIRHIGDKFNLLIEIGSLIIVYTFFCYIQYILYIVSLAVSCSECDLN